MRPTPVAPTSASSTQLTQASKESTPMPDNVPRAVKVPVASSLTTEPLQEARLLAESFNMTLRYMDEYIDENPLLGEPGSFILTSAHGSSQSKHLSQPKSTSLAKPADSEMTDPPTDGDGSNATAKKTIKSEDKGPTSPSLPGKPKRRKSKAAGVIGGGVIST